MPPPLTACLLAGHMTGEYAVETPSLLPYVKKAHDLRKRVESKEADRLSNVGVKMNA